MSDPFGERRPATATRCYIVEGMTCAHCERAVLTAIERVRGIDEAAVDRSSGRLTVTGGVVADEEIEAAVTGAGYRVAGRLDATQ